MVVLSKQQWEKWNNSIKHFKPIYNPPQFKQKPSCLFINNFYNCISHNSNNLFCQDCISNDTSSLCLLLSQVNKYNLIKDPDIFLNKMLNNRSQLCPDFLKGVWWMKDNIVNERFITFDDADWKNNRYAIKNMKYNWTNDNTCQGNILSCLLGIIPLTLIIEISDDNKWIAIKYAGQYGWIKIVQEPIKYANDWIDKALENKIVAKKGDLCRYTFSDNLNANSDIKYQYVMKRVAYRDSSGKIIKTPEWYNYIKRCNIKCDKEIFKKENPIQITRLSMNR